MHSAQVIVIGAGSAGSTLAGRLAEIGQRDILVLEAGPTHRHPLVRVPFGLI